DAERGEPGGQGLGLVLDIALSYRPWCDLAVDDETADAPYRRWVLESLGEHHCFATRGILCGGPWRSSTSLATSSMSGSIPTAACTASVTRVRRSVVPRAPSVA